MQPDRTATVQRNSNQQTWVTAWQRQWGSVRDKRIIINQSALCYSWQYKNDLDKSQKRKMAETPCKIRRYVPLQGTKLYKARR